MAEPLDVEEEERPWERFGVMRRDCEPHRGHLVDYLGGASLVLGAFTLCIGLPGFVGLPLGLAAYVMAYRDLARMRAGLMDRRGEKRTRRGGDNGLIGALLSLLFLAAWAVLVLDKLLPPPYGQGW
jgi:hypothetical protein